ncbi:hypothetical protein [Caldiplasma sukawensis]
MKEIERKILISLNWPFIRSETYKIPINPYNISKIMKLNQVSVNLAWKNMINDTIIKDIIFLPDYRLNKKEILLSPVNQKVDLKVMIDSLDYSQNIDMIHLTNIYEGRGKFSVAEHYKYMIIFEVINDFSEKMEKQLIEFMKIKYNSDVCIFINNDERKPEMKKILADIVDEISYKNLSFMEHFLSEKKFLNKSFKKYLPRLYEERLLHLFPLVDFKMLKTAGFFVIFITYDEKERIKLHNLSGNKFLSSRFLLLRRFSRSIVLLYYYETVSEVDSIIEIFNNEFTNVVVFTYFKTLMNEKVFKIMK